jgi:aspartokinase
MKFGGTSMGDATCIKRAAEIVAESAKESAVVVVVSAIRGVTMSQSDSSPSTEKPCRNLVHNHLLQKRRRRKSPIQEKGKVCGGTCDGLVTGIQIKACIGDIAG